MTLRLRENVSLAETADGSVLLDQRSGEYWQLNHSASLTLRMLLEGASEDEVAGALIVDCPAGEVSAEQAVLDIRELAEQLIDAELTVRL
ncbi:lasso peptide biosynthesis PqqD family chaperone [Streptomyces sp. SAJ15]|uniref:lasso peptide biosynthesis PqqD family chaperone n=1 Tax=Streptomyces sp. SAJ15 TaxID=2011095 RepID=UPI0011872659|nr:lasso peptide biosynthesis PqqD family chaperone [Streptomyces sp. SAJ15]TVL87534.1 PqqD family protein [Streptomyces sp. SAJ15]